MKFSSLEQRMAQTFIDMFPKFVPDENAPVSLKEQEEFYLVMDNLYQLGFDNPLLFVSSLHEDDVYPSRFKKPYGKPDLILNMHKYTKEVNGLLQNMYLLGKNNDVGITKRQRIILSKLGISDLTKIPPAWSWMAKRSDINAITFSHCFFKKDYPYLSDIYAPLLGDLAFRKLEKWMIEQGYKQYVIHDATASECKLSLTYANPVWSEESPKGGFEYKIKHTGISVLYEPFTQCAFLGLCIPNGLKMFLEAFDTMDTNLKQFVLSRTKQCDKCNYCVQTDKTGGRALAHITVNKEQQQYDLCPYFPGYQYSWRKIDDKLADQLIDFLSFMDRFKKQPKQ
jgi:hypothetical protein